MIDVKNYSHNYSFASSKCEQEELRSSSQCIFKETYVYNHYVMNGNPLYEEFPDF